MRKSCTNGTGILSTKALCKDDLMGKTRPGFIVTLILYNGDLPRILAKHSPLGDGYGQALGLVI